MLPNRNDTSTATTHTADVLFLSTSLFLLRIRTHSHCVSVSFQLVVALSFRLHIHNHSERHLVRTQTHATPKCFTRRMHAYKHTHTPTFVQVRPRLTLHEIHTIPLQFRHVCARVCVYVRLLLIRYFLFLFIIIIKIYVFEKSFIFFTFSPSRTHKCALLDTHKLFFGFYQFHKFQYFFFVVALENFQLTSIRFDSIYRFRGFSVKK